MVFHWLRLPGSLSAYISQTFLLLTSRCISISRQQLENQFPAVHLVVTYKILVARLKMEASQPSRLWGTESTLYSAYDRFIYSHEQLRRQNYSCQGIFGPIMAKCYEIYTFTRKNVNPDSALELEIVDFDLNTSMFSIWQSQHLQQSSKKEKHTHEVMIGKPHN